MKVTVCFENVRVVVPCGDGTLLVRDLMHEAILRYRKATGKTDNGPTIISLSSLTGGGLLDPDDRLCDVADDREQIVAHLSSNDGQHHVGGDGASSVGTNSPDLFHIDSGNKEHQYLHHQTHHHHRGGYGMDVQSRINSNIKRESVKRLSMHALSTREPCLSTYSALSLPRESRRREPLGQDAKAAFELTNFKSENSDSVEIREVIIKNDTGPLGLHVVPCYDLLGNDQGLRVEGIEPNGRIAKDGQIDLHDKIIKMNGHNLLRIPFSKVQDIFRTCMAEKCLRITIMKTKKPSDVKSVTSNMEKIDIDDGSGVRKLQSSNNILQNANTRKIGRMIEIELTKGSSGLGFSVTTRDNPAGGHCPIYIKNILPKGAAVEDGRLRSGDRLLEVNKIEMTGKSQTEVVSLLRSIPVGGKVRMTVSRQEEVSTSTALNSEATNTANNNNNQSIVESNLETSPDNARWNMNISSTSSIQSPIKNETHDNVDSRYDKLQQLPFKSITTTDDVVLSPRKNRMILTLDIPVHDSEKAGLGVSVKGKTSSADDNTNMDLGIFIKSVLYGGAASRDGRLHTNDQLLNVNGVSLLGLSNSDAMETLRRAMLNTNSSVPGVITLTIARRVSPCDNEKHFLDNGIKTSSPTSSCKIETANSIFISDSVKPESGNGMVEKKNINNQTDSDDAATIVTTTGTSSTTISNNSNLLTSPWNPVIERLTDQYNKNGLRNESYCLATNKTWIESTGNGKKLIGQRGDDKDLVLIEETNENNKSNDVKKIIDDKDSQYSGDLTYDSQLSLDEFNNLSGGNKFSRDAIGRQSMSEKRHAALDAKNTDTYKRNKKLREGRENNKSNESGNKTDATRGDDTNKLTMPLDNEQVNVGESSFEINRRRFEKKNHDTGSTDYVYTIPGCNNKFSSPRKHWLVDDETVNVNAPPPINYFKQEQDGEGFSNSRGDVKQASLNSALDKRSRRKGFKSMLRLGKNRKSLNFGDNIEARHETIVRLSSRQLLVVQKRFGSKIQITKPRKPHYVRGVFDKFVTPYYPPTREVKPIWEVCENTTKAQGKERKPNQYECIIARECLNWFKNSQMVGFLHKNSIKAEDQLDFNIELRRHNMYTKYYSSIIFKTALKDTIYETVLPLFCSHGLLVFSPEPNVEELRKILRQTPQMILLAGILNGTLLNVNDFLKYGKMDITGARAGLVHTLRTAGGSNLCRQLTHHQSSFVARLDQIRDGKIETDDKNKTKSETDAVVE